MAFGYFLCGVEEVKHCVNVNLDCIVNNLKVVKKILTMPPLLEKHLRTPMVLG